MVDKILINTRLARWAVAAGIRRFLKKKWQVDGEINIRRLVLQNDDNGATVDVELSAKMNKDDLERLINRISKGVSE